jgi:two-component system sensor histidine kinase/response regulator
MPQRETDGDQAHQLAGDTEQFPRAILEMSFDAFLKLDRAGIITEWNARAENLFGWAVCDVIGKPADMLVPERHREAFSADLGKILAEGASFAPDRPTPARTVHRDGRELSAELILYPGLLHGDYRLSVFVRDLTERKRLENALGEIEDHRAILNFMEDGYTELDLRGNTLFVNDAYCRMFNRTREEVLDPDYLKLIHNPVSLNIRELFKQVYQTGEPVKGLEYEYTPGRFCEITVSLKRGKAGQPTGFVNIIRESTLRRQHEQELARAKEAAESANKAKSEFLANMSHEIRTPMNGIMGMTELALGTDLTTEQRDFLETVRSSADSLLGIINDILDFSKIEAGKIRLDPVQFDLIECVAVTLKSLALSAHAKGLELALHLDPESPRELIGDATRLRQVLLNLIGNAIKFTQTGEVVLDVRVEQRLGSELKLHFSVRDTGIGVPPEKQSRIFDAFEQADTSTTRKYGGTGLGLAISKRIVNIMGGEIWLESEAGAGSTFHFTAQFVATEGSACVIPASVEDLDGIRVLIVDDNATNRWILVKTLRHWKMEPEEADSGPAGLAKLDQALRSEHPIGLILLDEQMPGMDGLEVIQRIRANPLLSSATIMMLTSADQSSSAARCRELAVESYLVKPIQPAELQMAIRRSLGMILPPPVVRLAEVEPKAPAAALRILVAEDNPVNQRLAERILQKMGHQVTLASSGTAAVAQWSSGEFDLIFMDVQMPEMDGFEATRAIRVRELTTGGHVPIVAMTARAMLGDREACLEAGMDDYVSKPVSITAIGQSIARFARPAAAADLRSGSPPTAELHGSRRL